MHEYMNEWMNDFSVGQSFLWISASRIFLLISTCRQLGRHPNVNAFLGLYENKKYYMIVLEFMKGGELLDILIRRVESGQLNYSEAQVAIILR